VSFDVEIPDAVIVPVVISVNNGKNSWSVVVSLNTVEPAPVRPEPSPTECGCSNDSYMYY
jgi:hypothetical protein